MKGQICLPKEWGWSKIKHTAQFFTGWTPPTGNSASFDGDNRWANISDLGPRQLMDTSKRISDEAVRDSAIKMSPKGSILFSFKLSIGQVSFAGRDLYTNEAIATFPPQPEFNTRWAYWAFPVFIPQNANENIYGAKLLNQELIRSADILIPPPGEQESIANFLDEQTARIDALIAGKKRLIESLIEMENAEITVGVTKGVNPNAALTKANQAWLGSVPSHWIQSRVRRSCFRVTDGAHISPDLECPDYPFVSTVDIAEGLIGFESCLRTTTDCYEYLARTGCKPKTDDVLFSKDGTIGRTAIVPADAPDFVVASSLVILSPRIDEILPQYLNYWLNNQLLKQHVELNLAGAALRRISVEKVGRLPLLIPPMTEQREIVDMLDASTKRFRSLRNCASAFIERLTEYRSSLISAAVTGQIDINNFQLEAA